MNKFLIASLAVLCTLFISCSKQEIDFETIVEHQIQSRSISEISFTYVDSHGVNQSITCKEVQLSYLSSSSIQLNITYINGTTETKTGNNIDIIPGGQRLQITTSPGNSFLTTDFYVQSCNTLCCYNYNGGNNVGTGSFFVIEDEPAGF